MTGLEQPRSIMIVDDTPENLHLLSEMLRHYGFRVRTLPSGRLALRSAAFEAPDLVLLDINMPEMNGYEVAERLKADDRLRAVPIIFISALHETVDKILAFQVGGVDYITKPFQVEEVVARVRLHLDLRHAQTTLEEKNQLLEKTLHDLRETQAQLVQSEKMASLGVLTAGIAHEINNPLNFVLSGTKGLAHLHGDLKKILAWLEQLTPENAAEELVRLSALKQELDYAELMAGIDDLMDGIRAGAERTASIVQGLRTFSRLDEHEKKKIDIHESIDSALMLLRHHYQGYMGLQLRYSSDLPAVPCYPGKLNQVFMNLLKNAIDAVRVQRAGRNKEVRVETARVSQDERSWVTVTIGDTGDGMTREQLDHIFEPFYTTKQIGQGVGLGLSISHGIIVDHGGRIEVETELGLGSTFRIWLPLENER